MPQRSLGRSLGWMPLRGAARDGLAYSRCALRAQGTPSAGLRPPRGPDVGSFRTSWGRPISAAGSGLFGTESLRWDGLTWDARARRGAGSTGARVGLPALAASVACVRGARDSLA